MKQPKVTQPTVKELITQYKMQRRMIKPDMSLASKNVIREELVRIADLLVHELEGRTII